MKHAVDIFSFLGSRRPIYFHYEMTTIENTFKTVDSLISDWNQIVYLYTLVNDLSEYLIKGMFVLILIYLLDKSKHHFISYKVLQYKHIKTKLQSINL